MKETDRSALARIFSKWDPLNHSNHAMTVEQEADPGFDRMVLWFSFDYEGNLIDFGARVKHGIPEET